MPARAEPGGGEKTVEAQPVLEIRLRLRQAEDFAESFHWPRFFSSSTRSKRFKTFRLAVIVLAPFRLRCCDIKNAPG